MVGYYLLTKQYETLFYYLLKESKKSTQTELDYQNMRKYVNLGSQILRRMQSPPNNVTITKEALGGIPCLHAIPSTSPKRTIFYLHGGSFIVRLESTSHETIIGHLAEACEAEVWALDYRIAPEDAMPAALDDTYYSFLSLLDTGVDPEKVFVIGDSAGGYLTLALMLELRDTGQPFPKAAVALSPVTGADTRSGSYLNNQDKDPFLTLTQIDYIGPIVFGTSCCNYPEAPLHRELNDLPPMLIMVGGNEILYDDSVLFAEKAKAAGVDVTLDINDGMFHAYPIFIDIIPQAKEGFDKIVSYVKEHTV